MKSGVCPKCGSSEVYSGADVPNKGGYRDINSIPIDGFFTPYNAPLDNYICVACGYVESYISDLKALNMIAAKWQRADGRKKKKNDE